MNKCISDCLMYPMGPWCIECKHCSEKFQNYTRSDIERDKAIQSIEKLVADIQDQKAKTLQKIEENRFIYR